MVMPVKREKVGDSNRTSYRLGVLERRKKTNNKYCLSFYKRAGLKNLLKDLKVDLRQLPYFLRLKTKEKKQWQKRLEFYNELKQWE